MSSLKNYTKLSVDVLVIPMMEVLMILTGLQINLYLEQPMEIHLFAKFFQRRK
jgi:hypothetical protein